MPEPLGGEASLSFGAKKDDEIRQEIDGGQNDKKFLVG